MSFYEFQLADGEDLVIEKAGTYTDGSLDLSVEFGGNYRDFYECTDAYEVLEWVAEAGGRFATAKTALFNYAYLQSLIDGDWSDEGFAYIVDGDPEKWLTKKILAACGAKADEAEDDVPEIEDGELDAVRKSEDGRRRLRMRQMRRIERISEILDFCETSGIEWYIDLYYHARNHRRDWLDAILYYPEYLVAVLESKRLAKAN